MIARKHILLTLLCAIWTIGSVSAQDDTEVTVDINNELNVNTEGLEFSPTFYEDGIVFISTNSVGMKK
ncbi:MAG: hypothetical protein R2792_14445 [Saprospiraceae bacterium]